MQISVKRLQIDVSSDGRATIGGMPFVEAQISGFDKDSHLGAKMIHSSEGSSLRYVSHEMAEGRLTIVQASDRIKATTVFTFGDYDGYSAGTTYTNLTGETLTLEETSAFVLGGFAEVRQADKITLYSFLQSHHHECQPTARTLAELGFRESTPTGQYRVAGVNVGSWSTKEQLPQGILDIDGAYVMFQLESNNSWYYEISDDAGDLYLYLGGRNLPFNSWQKHLRAGESYTTDRVTLCFGSSLSHVIGEMTKYRRTVKGVCRADRELPTIFNEYMHLSWDCPSEENTLALAPFVADLGVKYYVIDCGWHNEEDGRTVYTYVGQWKESKTRFPHGVRAVTDYIRSLGMRAGLWIEPEIIGKNCTEMLDYYDEDCFIRRNGKKVCVMGRYFLDFRHPKVIGYMNETIRRMVEDYGADYIKMDYNEDLGVGTDEHADACGEGLEMCANAYLDWVDGIRARFPGVLLETCSSGGMRMDARTLGHFSIVSTSDQIHYDKYPYIAGNILSAVLPEQAAVWSYPVGSDCVINGVFRPTEAWMRQNVTDEQVVMNMINALLGRMHLASHLEMLTKRQSSLVREGLAYFDALSHVKTEAIPCFPCGFTYFGAPFVACGFTARGALYLAVWNLSEDSLTRRIPVGNAYRAVECAYPRENSLAYDLHEGILTVHFTQKNQARFFELY